MVYHGVSLIELEVGMPSYAFLLSSPSEVMPYWEETIAPMLKQGKTVFVAAHGNSIRAIVKMRLGSGIVVDGKVIKIQTGACVLDLVEWQLMERCTNLIISSYIYIYIIWAGKKTGSIRYILGGVLGLAPFDFLKRPATKYDV